MKHYYRKQERLGLPLGVNITLTCLYVLWAFVPYLTRNLRREILLVIVAMWVLTTFLSYPRWVLRPDKFNVIVLLWITYIGVSLALGRGLAEIGNFYNYICFFIPGIMYTFYKRLNRKEVNRFIVFFALLVAAVSVITNIQLLVNDPSSSKEITGGSGDLRHFYASNTNLGSFSWAQTVVILTGILGGLYVSQDKKVYKFISFVGLCCFALMVILSSSFIAILSLVVLLSSYIALRLRSKGPIFSIVIMLCLIHFVASLVIFSEFYAGLLEHVSFTVGNPMLSRRIRAMADVFWGRGGNLLDRSLSARLELYWLSLKTFFRSPFFGRGMVYADDYFQYGIGMHSQILDDAARYGLVGIIVYSILGRYLIRWIGRSSTFIKAFNMNVATLVSVAFMALFNPFVSTSNGVAVFLVFTLWGDLVSTDAPPTNLDSAGSGPAKLQGSKC